MQFDQLRDDDSERGARLGLIQTHEQILRTHLIAVLHKNLADDATAWVLHPLDIAVDNDEAAGNDRTRELRRRHPATHAEQQECDRRQADDQACLQVANRRSRHPLASFSETNRQSATHFSGGRLVPRCPHQLGPSCNADRHPGLARRGWPAGRPREQSELRPHDRSRAASEDREQPDAASAAFLVPDGGPFSARRRGAPALRGATAATR